MTVMDFPGAVQNPNRLFGREQEIITARDLLRAHDRTPLLVTGERRTGKSSFYNIALASIEDDVPLFVPVKLHGRDHQTVELLCQAIILRLSIVLRKNPVGLGVVDAKREFHMRSPGQFLDALNRLIDSQDSLKLLLAIDEFDATIANAQESGPDEADKLRDWVEEILGSQRLPFRTFFTLTRIDAEIHNRYGSLLIDPACLIELRPFEEEKTLHFAQFLLTPEINPSPEILTWMKEMSGGNPFYLKLLAAHLIKAAAQNAGSPESWIPKATLSARTDQGNMAPIANIFKVQLSPIQQEILLFTAWRNEPVSEHAFQKASSRHHEAAFDLVQRAYLTYQDGFFNMRFGIIGEWLRNWVEFEEEINRLSIRSLFSA